HKIDAIKRCSKASFCVYDKGCRKEGDWALNIKSVIVFGQIEIVEDRDKTYEISSKLSRKFTSDEEYIKDEVERAGFRTLVFALVPEHMTGKLVNEK
ncbi:MAG: pyridoxamine 5'-phosphate oxidase family protein, partial [Firmicutes bacterium]|nr:pyridoxamine 5'-phosphate oxidase family protein [Bacillota bacterium]